MFDPLSRQRSKPSLFAIIGGVHAAAAIALSAYAAHGVADAHLQGNLQNAALYAFGHGLALACLGPRANRTLARTGLGLLLLGTLLFSGSLAANAWWGFTTKPAPLGGIALMLGWLLWAFDALRR